MGPALKRRNESDAIDQTQTMIVFETFQGRVKEANLFARIAASVATAGAGSA